MNVRKKWILFIVGLLACYSIIQSIPSNEKTKENHFLKQRDMPLVIAHGGAKELYPENTIYAFNQVYNMNVDAIEVDVRMSKDFVLCSVHDENISHYTNQKGRVQDYSYRELSSFNFAYYFKNDLNEYSFRNVDTMMLKQLVPMNIKDMFSTYKKKMLYILEIKEVSNRGIQCANILYHLIKKYNLEDYVCVAAFDDKVIDYFKRISNHEIMVSMGYKSAKEFVVANYIGYDIFMSFNKDGLLLPLNERNISLDDKYLIYKIHRNNKFIYYWTINDRKVMEQLIDKNVDGIISDRPDILLELIKRKSKE